MLLNESSDIVIKLQAMWSEVPSQVDLVHLKGDKVLAISNQAMRLYSSLEAISDPLCNGLMDSCEWSKNNQLCAKDSLKSDKQSFVQNYKAGVVHLQDHYTLLITPVAIQLFATPNDALHNLGQIASLSLT